MGEMLVNGLSLYGTKERVGDHYNYELNRWYNVCGFNNVNSKTKRLWCGLFLNYLAYITNHERSGKLDARSWLKTGYGVTKPKLGDIVVLWRDDPSTWKGHAGLFIRKTTHYIWILGGNQSNEVNISKYPCRRILGYRRLRKV